MKQKFIVIILLSVLFYHYENNKISPKIVPSVTPIPYTPIIVTPKAPTIEDYTLGYQNYDEIINMVKNWEKESPLLIETGYYGKTSKNNDCFYFKISNENNKIKYKTLITACIHGNEPWSTSTIMSYAGWIVSNYGKNDIITHIIDNTEIYFIPVVSPDSYPFSRSVDGVDPNRNFPTISNPDKKSVPPVQNLKNFFLKIKPNSILSGHTYGRLYLVPWGDNMSVNPNEQDYKRVASKMGELSRYKWMKASQIYNSPIIGAECDWYHRNGSFAMVIEFGTHQRKPSENDTEIEFERTKEAFLFFIQESVKINIVNNYF